MEELLLEALGKLLNIKPAELASTLKDADGNLLDGSKTKLIGQIETHVENVQKESLNDGRKKGKAEALNTFEKDLIKEFNFDNADNLEGLKLVQSIFKSQDSGDETIEKLKSELEEAKKSKKFTEDDIKKSTPYLALEQQLTDSKAEFENQLQEKEKSVRAEYQKKEVFSQVKEKAMEKINSLNLLLPEDDKIKNTQLDRLVFSQMQGFDYQMDEENPKPLIIDPETGKRKENKLGHALDFDEFVESLAKSSFVSKVSDPKDPPGPGGPPKPPGGNGKPADLSKYKSSEEIIKDRSIPFEKRKEMVKQFDEQQN